VDFEAMITNIEEKWVITNTLRQNPSPWGLLKQFPPRYIIAPLQGHEEHNVSRLLWLFSSKGL
jgi:hypothetical protein